MDLGKFIAGLRYGDIPGEAAQLIKIAFVDCIGVMIAGAAEDAVRILESTLAPAPGNATIAFSNRKASGPDAAWINATAAHVLDFDDFARLGGHPSAVLLPAILADSEVIGASGQQMLCAYAAGFETWFELLRREADFHHNKGWHPTGIFGAIAAAAACASLRRLNAEQAAHAIALAASQSAGVLSNFGTMTKSLHAGRAAHSGIISASLAANGFTAAHDALEHPAGFLAAVSPAGKIDVESPVKSGIEWQLLSNRLSVKKYPMCFATHRALDGMLDLVRSKKVDGTTVRRIEVSLSRRNAAVLRNHAPQTALEAKFSMEFAMACALIERRVGLSQLKDELVRRPDVQSLMRRVELNPLAEDRNESVRLGFSAYDRVILEIDLGDILDSGPVSAVRGDPDCPLTVDELWAKFEDCLAVGNTSIPARELFNSLMSLERIQHVSEIPGLRRHDSS
jgi:2-methylcitrate dehydratase PrpD